MKKTAVRFFAILCSVILLMSSAAAEWKKIKEKKYDYKTKEWGPEFDTWVYQEDGKTKRDFLDRKSIEIPSEVDHIEIDDLRGLSRDFVLKVDKGSYAENFAKQFGFQYDNGEKQVVGYDITDLEKKTDWIISNYVVDNYKGSQLTEEETARVLHDWLTTNATYDYYGLKLEEEDKKNNTDYRKTERPNMFAAEGVLLEGTGVCDSYAQAYSYLLNKVNIQNRYVVGDTYGKKTGTNHAWDLVLLDGQWQFVDVTWDDPGGVNAIDAPVTTGAEGYGHFLLTDEEMSKATSEDAPSRTWTPGLSADDNTAGFVFAKDGTYYYGDKSNQAVPTTGWVEVKHNDDYSSAYYWMYDPNKNQKLYEQEGKYYFTEDGTMAVGWEDISKDRYYFSENGLQKFGWLTENEAKYHLDEKTGAMDTDWTTLTEQDYGIITTNTYYFGDDGKMRIGFVNQDGKTYHMDNKGRMQKDTWIEDAGSKYHASTDGTMDTGWTDLKSGGNIYTYYFDEKGKMQTGFVDSKGNTYYLNSYGMLEKDKWVTEDENKYHAGKDGALDKGRTDIASGDDTNTYWFDDKGKMQTGFMDQDGKTYYLSKYDGRMQKDVWIYEDSDRYHARKDGALDKGLTDIAIGDYINTYYFDENGKMQTGFVESDGKRYHMDENGLMEKNTWVKDGKDQYHMGADGTPDTGWQTIQTENYYFDTDGTLYDRNPGDLNDDEAVDGRDAVHLMKWLAGDEVEEDTPFCANGDVDHNKEVDEHDLLCMMKYFGGEKVDLE